MSCCSGASSSRVFFRSPLNSEGRLLDPIGLRSRVGHEIARGEPQLIGAPVDLLGEVADVLQTLQFRQRSRQYDEWR